MYSNDSNYLADNESNQQDPQKLLNASNLFLRKKPEQALEKVKEAERIAPNNVNVLLQMAYCYYSLQKEKECIRYLNKLMEKTSAIDIYQDRTKKKETKESTFKKLAEMTKWLEQYEFAGKSLDPKTFYQAAQKFVDEQNYDEALLQINIAYLLDSKDKYQVLKANILIEQRQFEEAQVIIKLLIKSGAEEEGYLNALLGNVLFEREQYAEARDAYQKAKQLGGEDYIEYLGYAEFNPKYHFTEGKKYYEKKAYKDAATYFKHAKALAEPAQPEEYLGWYKVAKGLDYFEQDDYQKAIKHLKLAIEYGRNTSLINAKLAHAYYEEKDWQQAINYYQQAIKLSQSPENISVYQAKLQKANKRLQDALNQFQQGIVLAERLKFEEAVKVVEKAIEIAPHVSAYKETLEKFRIQRKVLQDFKIALLKDAKEALNSDPAQLDYIKQFLSYKPGRTEKSIKQYCKSHDEQGDPYFIRLNCMIADQENTTSEESDSDSDSYYENEELSDVSESELKEIEQRRQQAVKNYNQDIEACQADPDLLAPGTSRLRYLLFRSENFSKHKYGHNKRLLQEHIAANKVGVPTLSSAVRMICRFDTEEQAQESKNKVIFKQGKGILNNHFQSLKTTFQCDATTGLPIARTLFDKFTYDYVQKYRQLFTERQIVSEYQFPNDRNPIVSTSLSEKRAINYLSVLRTHEDNIITPHYRLSTGRPKHRHVGIIYTYIMDHEYFKAHGRYVLEAVNGQKIDDLNRKNHEQEVFFPVFIPGRYRVHKEVFIAPSFADSYQKEKVARYGLDKAKYGARQRELCPWQVEKNNEEKMDSIRRTYTEETYSFRSPEGERKANFEKQQALVFESTLFSHRDYTRKINKFKKQIDEDGGVLVYPDPNDTERIASELIRPIRWRKPETPMEQAELQQAPVDEEGIESSEDEASAKRLRKI